MMFTEIYTPTVYIYDFTPQEAQEIRCRMDDLKTEKIQQEEKREQESGQAKRPYTKRIKEINAELETLARALSLAPPEPLSNLEALNIMKERLARNELEYHKQQERAIQDIQNNFACHNASWHLPELFRLEFEHNTVMPLLEIDDIYELYERLHKIYKRYVDLLLSSNNIYNSTSEMSNVSNMIEHQARSRMVTAEMLWWLGECERLVERVKAFDWIVNNRENC